MYLPARPSPSLPSSTLTKHSIAPSAAHDPHSSLSKSHSSSSHPHPTASTPGSPSAASQHPPPYPKSLKSSQSFSSAPSAAFPLDSASSPSSTVSSARRRSSVAALLSPVHHATPHVDASPSRQDAPNTAPATRLSIDLSFDTDDILIIQSTEGTSPRPSSPAAEPPVPRRPSPPRLNIDQKISNPPLHSPSNFLRSPSVSPRKRRSTASGSRYSPPPAFFPSAVPQLPSTPPIPRSPSGFESAFEEYFGGPYSATSPRKERPPSKRSDANSLSTTYSAQSGLSSQSSSSRGDTSRAMATNSARRPAQSIAGVRLHNRTFSSDMRSITSEEQERQRQQRERDRDRKQMLNRALQKAHTAVLLDNAYNYEGAIEAYEEACSLLNQVLVRSTADEEKRKLDQIRETYTRRIQELVNMDRESDEAAKSLPARPMSDESSTSENDYSNPEDEEEEEEETIIETATVTRIERSRSPAAHTPVLSSEVFTDPSTNRAAPTNLQIPSLLPSLSSPMDPTYAPPPLSPRRIPKDDHPSNESNEGGLQPVASNSASASHSRGGSISWLGALSSGASSERSSIHSIVEGNIRREPFPPATDDTQAQFDAAFDAAVEAAYDDGFEPAGYDGQQNGAEKTGPATNGQSEGKIGGFYLDSDDEDAEEEERLLDQITYDLEGFDFGLQGKNQMTRDSDGSQFSGSTWHSSVGSTRTTQSTLLSTVTESSETTLVSGGKIVGTLPRLSEETSRPDSMSFGERPGSKGGLGQSATGSVRSRRMSGQNAKQLKIETQPHTKATTNHLPTAPPATIREEPSGLRSAGPSVTDLSVLPDAVYHKANLSQQSNGTAPSVSVPFSAGPRPVMSPAETALTISPATPGLPLNSIGEVPSPGAYRVPGTRPFLRKNKSSMSLKNRSLSVSSPDGSDGSVATPMSTTFTYSTVQSTTALTRKATNPAIATPSIPVFPEGTAPASSIHLFESDIHSPHSPGFPNPLNANAPVQLEPCPESTLLRPYWLLRAIYQTIAHPRGGYLSTKLFVPRDIWRVKNVKIKGLDDKIAQLDVLTDALARLNQLDTNDMDAMLPEMEALEGVLDSVQALLTKKLGHDVGTHSIQNMFRDAPVETSSPSLANGEEGPKTASTGSRSSSKSYLSSWRKLRSKTSSTGLSGQGGQAKGGAVKDAADAGPTMSTIPMTTLSSVKFAKRDPTNLDVSVASMGQNAAYMVALARVCDAVQIVDHIARQVEDPGLKGSSKTHVGLELCTKHASEFFGFFICRFVLQDIALLLDKYLKRGTEWVLT